MGTFFGRRRTQPVGIEFALDLTADTVTLFERAPVSGWKRFAAAELDDQEFPIVIGLLRNEAEAHAGARSPVRIWLPSDQVLRKRAPIDGETPEARLSAAFDFVARETVYRPEDVAIAVAPESRDGQTTILITFAETWHEARDYVERWGFLPGTVSTRAYATDFGIDGPTFLCQGQPIVLESPGRRPAAPFAVAPFAAAACLALIVAGGALGWTYYPQLSALIRGGDAPLQQVETTDPTEPSPLAATTTTPALSEPTGATSTAPADPPQVPTPNQPVRTEPAPSPSSVKRAPPDAGPAPAPAEAQRLDPAPPQHIATVPALSPRTASAAMPNVGSDLGPGVLTLAAFEAAPTGPDGRIEAAARPSAPPGPALPDPKLSDGGAWTGLTEPAEAGEPMPKVEALDLSGEATPAIDHNEALAALSGSDPLGSAPASEPSYRPETGPREPADLTEQTGVDPVPDLAAPVDPAPMIEVAALATGRDESAGATPAVEPPEPGDATKFAAKLAPLPTPAPGRLPVVVGDPADSVENDLAAETPDQTAAPDEAAVAALSPQDAARPAPAVPSTEALPGLDATGSPEPSHAGARPPVPPATLNRDLTEDTGEAGMDEDTAGAPAAGLAVDPAAELANLDVTIVPDIDRARASLPLPPPAPNRASAAAQADTEAGVDDSAIEPPGPVPVEAAPATTRGPAVAEPEAPPATSSAPVAPGEIMAPEITTPDIAAPESDAPEIAAPDDSPETPATPESADLLAHLDITVVPDLDEARTSLPFPPPAPGRTAPEERTPRDTTSDDDEAADDPGIGPATAALPKRRPAHLTRTPAPAAVPATPQNTPDANGGVPVEIRGSDPTTSGPYGSSVTALLPHGTLHPGVEPDPDAPTRYASLTAPRPTVRPALPPAARNLPGVNSLRLPKLSPGSVRDAATDQGLPLDRVALIGILDLDSGRKALLRMPNGRYRSVVTGDTIDGWQVRMIGVDAMRVSRGSQDQTLLLVNR